MAGEKVLIVEDEEDIRELVGYNFEREGYEVWGVDSGEKALSMVKSEAPDLIILDLMLPGVNGLEICKRLKNDERTAGIPVVMLTAKGEEADIVTGLELGADDYVTKPFSPRILLARVRSVMRRKMSTAVDGDIFKIVDIKIDSVKHEVYVGDKLTTLTLTEFNILKALSRRPGVVFTRYQIVDAVHSVDYAVTDRSVDVQIVGLRKKLGHAGKYIETVRGIGYKFKDMSYE